MNANVARRARSLSITASWLALAATGAVPARVDGQRTGGTPASASSGSSGWTTLEGRASVDGLSGGHAGWNEQSLRLDRRATARSGVSVGVQRLSRFGRDDRRVDFDASVALGRRVTAGVEGEASPSHAVVARAGGAVRLHASLGGGWGMQLRGGERRFDAATVRAGSATLERYWGRWLASYAFTGGRVASATSTAGHSLRLTRFAGERGAVTASVSGGREAESLGDAGVRVADVRAVAVWGDRPVSSRFALVYGGAVTRQGALYSRRTVSLGVRARLE